ncbi:accessory factor UbiK family protein [Acinetobacter nectaris]|uniref:accessory factor UbiK family protein n=1 Tax=Acinetobacter nectaris TaxID=1219382 RepID=UPI001F26CB98|nr:accessory factor UbiK family protein [Acinetobacter nectaris]MCF8999451.1 accessory factor UbiK family protein [Acinetobacter nectaris]MCF9027081.1 accessory factor UbiK family protein [Acinetobacter nectaris]
MIEQFIQSILSQIEQPKADLEHNLRALLSETIKKMDLVSKEEIERHQTALSQANIRVDELSQQVAILEQAIQNIEAQK